MDPEKLATQHPTRATEALASLTPQAVDFLRNLKRNPITTRRDGSPRSPDDAVRFLAHAQLAATNLTDFVRYTWPIIEGRRPLVYAPYIATICDFVQDALSYRLPSLEAVINIPPRTLKSTIVAVNAPAFDLLLNPHHGWMSITNSDDLSTRDSLKCRTIVQSPEYQLLIVLAPLLNPDAHPDAPPFWTLDEDQQEKRNFLTSERGGRQISTTNSTTITGKGADRLVYDDVLDASRALIGSSEQIAHRMLEVQVKHEEVWSSRLNDANTGVKLNIQQRLHDEDLSAHMIRQGAAHLVLPLLYDPHHPLVDPRDPRTTPLEVLNPERYPPHEIERIQRKPALFASQYQQEPTPPGGGMFPEDQWKIYTGHPSDIARDIVLQNGLILGSADLSSKDQTRNDPSAIATLGFLGDDVYILGMDCRRMLSPEQYQILTRFPLENPGASYLLIENMSNGAALVPVLSADPNFARNASKFIVPIQPRGSKEDRAVFTQTRLLQGNLYIADPRLYPWARETIQEHSRFPRGAHDDRVDAISQGVKWYITEHLAKRAGGGGRRVLNALSQTHKSPRFGGRTL